MENYNIRDIRHMVAEKVMGWNYFKHDHGYWMVIDPGGKREEHISHYFNSPSGERVDFEWWATASIPKYEEDEGLQVLDKLWSEGICLQLCSTQLGYRVVSEAGEQLSRNVENPSLAICIGALRVKGFQLNSV